MVSPLPIHKSFFANFECSYKYHPSSLHSALFPSPGHEHSEGQRSRKRRRVSPQTGSDNGTRTDSSSHPSGRSVVLETSSETFILRPQLQSHSDERDKENASTEERKSLQYSLALVVEESKETVVQDKDVEIPDAEPSGRTEDIVEPPKGDTETALAPPAAVKDSEETSSTMGESSTTAQPNTEPAVTSVSPTSQPLVTPSEAPQDVTKTTTVQVLQRDLGEDNLDFTEDGLNVLSGEVENGSRRGFKLEVKTWRWAEQTSEVIEVR